MGYTPLFDSIVRGTLYGRWPDIGLWPIVLALADKNGIVDCTPHYLAGVTGLPPTEIVACMERFCAPDPYSRSKDSDGARLVLVDPGRSWGWRVVNHAAYREKARLAAKSEREVREGINAKRMADRETAADRRPPPPTAADPLSNANTNTDIPRDGQPPSAFDRFWSSYPKKVKKKTASEIWHRKQLDRLAEEILADIPARIERDGRWQRGYIPDPPTYLGQERWRDDFEKPKGSVWQ